MLFITIKPNLNLFKFIFSIISLFEITIRKTRIQKMCYKVMVRTDDKTYGHENFEIINIMIRY